MFLLNIIEYCKYKGISEQGLYKRFRTNKDTPIKVDRKNYVRVDEEFISIIEKSNKKIDELQDKIKNLTINHKELEEKWFRENKLLEQFKKANIDFNDNHKIYIQQIKDLSAKNDNLIQELKNHKEKPFLKRVFNS